MTMMKQPRLMANTRRMIFCFLILTARGSTVAPSRRLLPGLPLGVENASVSSSEMPASTWSPPRASTSLAVSGRVLSSCTSLWDPRVRCGGGRCGQEEPRRSAASPRFSGTFVRGRRWLPERALGQGTPLCLWKGKEVGVVRGVPTP